MFASNTGISTSHNTYVSLKKGDTRSFRALLRPVKAGLLSWRFFFSNAVDSTWADGFESWADLPGGRFEIVSACVAPATNDLALGAFESVTWGGEKSRAVAPMERFYSDASVVCVPENGYIVFSWCLRALDENTVLPATPDSQALCFSAPGDAAYAPQAAYEADQMTVLPDGFEADRDVRASMVFMGDSITQGCGTRVNFYEQWATRIAMGMDADIAVWNIGLGYGRGADAAKDGVWLMKAAQANIVNLCFGVNDLLHGSQDADVLTRDITLAVRALKARPNPPKVVLLTIPPFDLTDQREANWREVNARIRANGHLGADCVFDIARVLGCPAPGDSRALYGGHPDGRGGAAVAHDYLTAFWPAHRALLLGE